MQFRQSEVVEFAERKRKKKNRSWHNPRRKWQSPMSLIAGVPVLILIGTMEDGPLMIFGVELFTPSVVLLILEMAP
jgi:hypothetical protein